MRKALGRGLDVLLPKGGDSHDPARRPSEVRNVLISSIKPNHLQPRRNIDAERLSELAQNIKTHGLAQPILVTYDSISNSYELIAGERRLRACQLAGLSHIDAVLKTPKDDKERLALAISENIQRDDLNAMETAHAYRQLIDTFEVTQSHLSNFLGKSKSAISNTLRLLDLPEEIQSAVQFEKISEGHARSLLTVSDAVERNKLFKMTIDRKLSVRDVERLAAQIQGGGSLPEGKEHRGSRKRTIKSANVRAIEDDLSQSVGTRVEIRTRKDEKSGKVIVHFYSLSDFDKIRNMLKK